MSGARINERRLLGAAMQFRTVLDLVDVDLADFADPRHAALWSLLVSLREKGRSTDAPGVLGALGSIPQQDRVGIDGPYLFELVQAAPFTASEGEVAARDLANDASLRRLEAVGQRAIQLAGAGGQALDHQEVVRNELEQVTSSGPVDIEFVGDGLDETLEEIDNPSPVIPTPWRELNVKMRGWRPGRLHVIGARPSVGKSIALLQAAIPLAEGGGSVLFHSLEMPKGEIQQRVIAQLAEVPLGKLAGVNPDDPDSAMTSRDWEKVAGVQKRISQMRLVIDDQMDTTVARIRAKARAVMRRGPLAGIFIDYLQLLDPPRHLETRSRAEVVGFFSRRLKALARELHVPVIVAVQLNRNSTQRDDPRPTMSDIRESGAVEQDSDIIILLHTDNPAAIDLDMFLVKQRQGQLGHVELTKQGHYARLVEREWHPTRTIERQS